MPSRLHSIRLLIALVLAALAQAGHAAEQDHGVGVKQITLVDEGRPIKPAAGFPGSPSRRIDLVVWYPTAPKAGAPVADAPLAKGGPWPLVIYSHGTFGRADNATHLTADLARHGYVVAAPNYPLTSSTAFTKVQRPEVTDVVNQVKDVGFVIDRLLADRFFDAAIDRAKIGTTGHSLGGVTSYFASFGLQTRDPRITATALIGAGDPVQAALSTDMGLAGTGHAAVSIPALFLSAEKDVFARMMGRPRAAYSRIETPKYEVTVKGGVHVWFRDGNEQPADGKNPDCLFFEKWMPGTPIPGCEERVPLIGPARQQEITRLAIRSFFDAYLKKDSSSLDRLRRLDRQFETVGLVYEE